jgi:EAL domain-containing protein (putative c-di-GMP-specific phosphodiesterase class I)
MAPTDKPDTPPSQATVDEPLIARGSGKTRQLDEYEEDTFRVLAAGTDPGNHLLPLERAASQHARDLSEPHSLPQELSRLEVCFERAMKSMYMSYQPIVWAHNWRSVFGYEALLRPNEPDLPHPGAMLDAADRLDRLQQLGRSIRLRVAEMYGTANLRHGLLFVNLHASDLLDNALLSHFAPLAKLASRVVLEITERSSLEGMTDVPQRVHELRRMGYQIAIDDFGAGHSRMKLFSPIDTDYVKLDMALVRGIHNHVAKRQLVSSITHLCRENGIKVIGEGVEEEAEANCLLELGCDLLQGFLIGKPRPTFSLS